VGLKLSTSLPSISLIFISSLESGPMDVSVSILLYANSPSKVKKFFIYLSFENTC